MLLDCAKLNITFSRRLNCCTKAGCVASMPQTAVFQQFGFLKNVPVLTEFPSRSASLLFARRDTHEHQLIRKFPADRPGEQAIHQTDAQSRPPGSSGVLTSACFRSPCICNARMAATTFALYLSCTERRCARQSAHSGVVLLAVSGCSASPARSAALPRLAGGHMLRFKMVLHEYTLFLWVLAKRCC